MTPELRKKNNIRIHKINKPAMNDDTAKAEPDIT
jgi:hypothetical protein